MQNDAMTTKHPPVCQGLALHQIIASYRNDAERCRNGTGAVLHQTSPEPHDEAISLNAGTQWRDQGLENQWSRIEAPTGIKLDRTSTAPQWPRAGYRAVGFSPRSLTRNTTSDPLGHFGQKNHLITLDTIEAFQLIDRRGQAGLSRPASPIISTLLEQDSVAPVRNTLIDFFSTSTLSQSGSDQRLAPLLRKGVCSFDSLAFSRASAQRHPFRGVSGQGDMGSPHRGEPMIGHLIEPSNHGQTLVKHLGTFV